MDRNSFLKQRVEAQLQKSLANAAEYYASPATAAAEPFRIADGLYYVGDKKVCIHLVGTSDGLILIDAGYPGSVHLLMDSILRLGFSPKDVRWILHTHGHFDHIGASEEFRRLYGTKLAISAAEVASVRENPSRVMLEWGSNPFLKFPVFDWELQDNEIFEFGGVRIRCVLTPGHSDGVMSFFFDVTDNGQTYLAGTFGGAGTAALSAEYMFHQNYPMDNPEKMLRSLDILAKEPVMIHLGNHPYNNHTFEKRAKQLREGGNPFVDAESWPQFLAELRERVGKYVAENVRLEAELQELFGPI